MVPVLALKLYVQLSLLLFIIYLIKTCIFIILTRLDGSTRLDEPAKGSTRKSSQENSRLVQTLVGITCKVSYAYKLQQCITIKVENN